METDQIIAQQTIDFTFDSETVSTPDGAFTASFSGVTPAAGPGSTAFGDFPQALDFGEEGKAKVSLAGLDPDFKQFYVQFAFRMNNEVSARQNLFESNCLPFAVFAVPGKSTSYFELRTTVRTAHGWSGADTFFRPSLKTDSWYLASLAYDHDTMELSVFETDGAKILSTVHAFPHGEIEKGGGNDLYIGTWTDGARDQFKGALAMFKWQNGLPQEIDRRIDEQRGHAEWFISYKYEWAKKAVGFGAKTEKLRFDSRTCSYIQYYEKGAVMYNSRVGLAFEMHGAIYEYYKSWPKRSELGYLVADEAPASDRSGRKSVFSDGGIYWSPDTGAIPVLGQMYIDYEHLGESGALGFPLKNARRINAGWEQEFQHARMYYRDGATNAHEVHGSILNKFLATGGVNSWGYPVTNEMDLLDNGSPIGRFSEFEGCTIYWKSGVGAFEVHGDIRRKYVETGGPAGELGFPTSDEKNIPGVAGAGRINTFQNGSILWYGSYNSIVVARPFRIFIRRIDSKEREGFGRGQNDIYFRYIRVREGSTYLFNSRVPESGDWGGRNVRDVNFTVPVTIVPNSINKSIRFSVSLYDEDGWSSPDDFLGNYSKTLNAANGWGLKDNGGVYDEKFDYINSFTWSVQPQLDVSTLSEIEKWWNVENQGTDTITYPQYAAAFRDVDSEREWWDITDWLEKAFYELVVEDLAEDGNCFGMVLEGIYARKSNSLFSMPINRFNNWEQLRNEFNIKHCYQVGADPIWWFVDQFLSGNTHDPVDVFRETRDAFQRGNHPVICISQDYWFSERPHCILPVRWDSSSKPWKMTVMDPNLPGVEKVLTVNPDNNTFEYIQKSDIIYRGGEWSGGRFHYMPFTVLNRAPRTPIWDAIMLLLTGTVIIFATDAETESITDENGADLDAFGERAKALLQNNQRPEGFFVGYQGFNRTPAAGPRQILARREDHLKGITDVFDAQIVDLPILEVVRDRRFWPLSKMLKKDRRTRAAVAGKSVNQILNNPKIKAVLTGDAVREIEKIRDVNASRNYIHKLRGKKDGGGLNYVVKNGLSEIKLEACSAAREIHQIKVKDIGSNSNTVKLLSEMDKDVSITITNKLGVAGDYIRMELIQVPVEKEKELELNVRSGIAGIDLMNSIPDIDIPVRIFTRIDGKELERSFNVPVENGIRLRPASLLAGNGLAVSRIDALFGPVLSTIQVYE